MRKVTSARGGLLSLSILASAALALPLASQAAAKTTKPTGRPLVLTGGVTQVRGTSGLLGGSVNPHGFATTYYFQYGPTIAYGSQTVPATLPAGSTVVPVGQTATQLLPGDHYRLVASNQEGPGQGRDRVFLATKTRNRLTLIKPTEAAIVGSPLIISGSLSGAGSGNRRIELQATPFPYLTAFSVVGTPVVTSPLGQFSFRVASLSVGTQYRVNTLDPLPLFSTVITAQVSPRVTLKVRSTSHKGLVRLFGTVTPAEVGAKLSFQLRKAVRPGKSEATTRFATQFSTVVKRGTKTVSRFSAIVTVQRGGRYRAFVLVHKGGLVSGSSPTVVLKAAPASALKPKK
jgi:hypothetical protein